MFICNHLTIQSNNWNKLIGFHIHGNGINGCEVYRGKWEWDSKCPFHLKGDRGVALSIFLKSQMLTDVLVEHHLSFRSCIRSEIPRYMGFFFLQSPITHPPLLRGWKNHVHPAVHKGKIGCKNVFQVNLYDVTAEFLLFFSTSQKFVNQWLRVSISHTNVVIMTASVSRWINNNDRKKQEMTNTNTSECKNQLMNP